MRHQPEIHDDAPCCPMSISGHAVLPGPLDQAGPRQRMGALYVLCSSDGSAVTDGFAEFEDWLARTFADVRVLERSKVGPRALEWVRHDCESRSRLDGWLSPDRTTVYLIGDPDLARQTAMAVRALFWAKGLVVDDIGVARLGGTVDRRRPATRGAPSDRPYPRHVPERRGAQLRPAGGSSPR